jgi:hypothetical protein
MSRHDGLVVNCVVAFRNVICQQLQMFLRQLRQRASANGAGGVAAESGLQGCRCGANSTDGRNLFDRQIGVLAGQRMSLSIADEHLRQGPHLHRFAVEARSFHP